MEKKSKVCFRVGFIQGGQRVPEQSYDLDHVRSALSFAIEAAKENRGGGLNFTELSPDRLIFFNSAHSTMRITTDPRNMQAVYFILMASLASIPPNFWRGRMNKEAVMDRLRELLPGA